ncbi:Nre family DNA repair protein [Vulcanisaeta thermophila]|uniref:Nre family DNA repair protein n=1 Tax=Vulcanisaeta thermophila TaxID=867917 RepID=UPI00085381C1|nr:Nre family DNA repair protein [Vulcanisaeta thermophila]
MRINPSLCIKCRGEYNLCGLAYCPVLSELRARQVISRVKGLSEVDGSSPPSVFVGRMGYPRVRVYPATPPVHGDTRYLEEPSTWLCMDLNEFISSRLSMVRGSMEFRVDDARNPPRSLHEVQVMALSSGPVDSELILSKPLRGNPLLTEQSPPFGPSAPLKELRISTLPPPPRIVDKVHGDTDLRASEAVVMLYEHGIDVNHIARLLSIGALGVGRRRRLVPTRWSITAVDKQVSDVLVRRIRGYPLIDEVRVYVREFRNNLFLGILVPHTWLYEWGEAWWPGSTWNLWGGDVGLELDGEGYRGRDEYPEIGGCYYAARIAVAEALNAMRRQAAVILWREVYPGFNLPVGVWFVRENVRAMFKGPYMRFDTVDEALRYAGKFLRLPIERWVSRSFVLRRLRVGGLT